MNFNNSIASEKENWQKTIMQANGYFIAYVIVLFVLSLWFYASGMKFYTAETGFYYTADNQSSVIQFIHKLESKYPISNSRIRFEEMPNKQGKLVINFEMPTAEHENEAFIHELHNNEYLIFNYDESLLIDNFFRIKTSYLIFYAFITLLMFIYWRMRFYHFEQNEQSTSKLILSLFKIFVSVVGGVYLLQICAWILICMGTEFQSDATHMITYFQNHPINYVLMTVILAPIQEELVFRGIVLRLFINQKRIILGTLVTSSLFAALHQIQMLQQPITDRVINYFVTFVVSVLFCYIYNKYRRIGITIFAHALFNLLMILLAIGIPF